MAQEETRYEERDGIAIVSINRPDKKNTLTNATGQRRGGYETHLLGFDEGASVVSVARITGRLPAFIANRFLRIVDACLPQVSLARLTPAFA
jgi:hypothetical protein